MVATDNDDATTLVAVVATYGKNEAFVGLVRMHEQSFSLCDVTHIQAPEKNQKQPDTSAYRHARETISRFDEYFASVFEQMKVQFCSPEDKKVDRVLFVSNNSLGVCLHTRICHGNMSHFYTPMPEEVHALFNTTKPEFVTIADDVSSFADIGPAIFKCLCTPTAV